MRQTKNMICSEQGLGLLAKGEGGLSILIIASNEGTMGDDLSKQILQLLACWWDGGTASWV